VEPGVEAKEASTSRSNGSRFSSNIFTRGVVISLRGLTIDLSSAAVTPSDVMFGEELGEGDIFSVSIFFAADRRSLGMLLIKPRCGKQWHAPFAYHTIQTIVHLPSNRF
jgi:hypothetical protein